MLREIFALFDADGDGVLEWHELKVALEDEAACLSRKYLLERLELEHSLYLVIRGVHFRMSEQDWGGRFLGFFGGFLGVEN